MSLISLQQAQLAYGHVALLDHVDFSLETQERVGLIGRNGTGKSSMLRILAGQEAPDDGTLQCQQGLRRAFVAQEPQLNPTQTVFESVSEGLANPSLTDSNTVCVGLSCGSCATKARRKPCWHCSVPSSGASCPARMRSIEDLPVPLRPISPTRSCVSREKSTWSRSATWP